MATIQVRDLTDETYAVIKQRAESAGQSLQRYVWTQLTEAAAKPTKAEVWERVEKRLADRVGPGPTRQEILDALHTDRR